MIEIRRKRKSESPNTSNSSVASSSDEARFNFNYPIGLGLDRRGLVEPVNRYTVKKIEKLQRDSIDHSVNPLPTQSIILENCKRCNNHNLTLRNSSAYPSQLQCTECNYIPMEDCINHECGMDTLELCGGSAATAQKRCSQCGQVYGHEFTDGIAADAYDNCQDEPLLKDVVKKQLNKGQSREIRKHGQLHNLAAKLNEELTHQTLVDHRLKARAAEYIDLWFTRLSISSVEVRIETMKLFDKYIEFNKAENQSNKKAVSIYCLPEMLISCLFLALRIVKTKNPMNGPTAYDIEFLWENCGSNTRSSRPLRMSNCVKRIETACAITTSKADLIYSYLQSCMNAVRPVLDKYDRSRVEAQFQYTCKQFSSAMLEGSISTTFRKDANDQAAVDEKLDSITPRVIASTIFLVALEAITKKNPHPISYKSVHGLTKVCVASLRSCKAFVTPIPFSFESI